MTVKGIDVSSYQAATWSTSGLSFVFAKATEGHTLVDSAQAAHAKRARAAGLTFGQYHFAWPGDVQAQAEWFVEKSVTDEHDLMAVDWEATSAGTRASNGDKDALIKAIKKLRPGHKVGLYTNSSTWLNVDKTGYYGDFLWIAEYGVPAGKPNITAPWAFHQYTSSPLDTNVANFASKAALQQWAAGATPPAPPSPPEPPVATNTQMLEDLTDDLLHIGSLSEKDAKGDPVEHGAGYYLAHTHYDALQLHDQAARIEDGQAALTAKVDALTAAVAELTGLVKALNANQS